MGDPIKAGDVVKLKSGGPSMTVDSVFEDWGALAAICSWFDGKGIKQNRFPVTSLVRVE